MALYCVASATDLQVSARASISAAFSKHSSLLRIGPPTAHELLYLLATVGTSSCSLFGTAP
jgi:hypothetical protein